MNRSELPNVRRRQSRSSLWIAALMAAAVVMGSIWLALQNRTPIAHITDDAMPQPAILDSGVELGLQLGVQPRASDAFSVELDRLRNYAFTVSNREQATAHALSLEALAQAGREAHVSSRLPSTANGYAVYLDVLRRQSQAAYSEAHFPSSANEFSEWLDRLRRQ